MKVLITGGTGLVGSSINIDGAVKVSSKDADLRDPSAVNALFNKVRPTHVIHCAARVGGVLANMNGNGNFFYDNIMMNTNVIEESRKWGVERMVCFVSTCIFPDQINVPLKEDCIHLGAPHSSNFGYAYAKRMVDVQIRAYEQQYGTNFVAVIPTNIYGPYDNFDLEKCHVVPALIRKCIEANISGGDFEVWGTGKTLREFVFSEDIGKLAEWALFDYKKNDPVILSSGQEVSIKQLAEIIANKVGYTKDIKWLPDKPEGQNRKPTDTSRLREYFPDFQFTSLEDGIEKTVEWYLSNMVQPDIPNEVFFGSHNCTQDFYIR
jgi:GDP-L-fucose synthase